MSPKLNLSKFRKILSFDTVCFFWWGLLSPIQTVETRTADPWGAGSSAARLGPWGLSAGVVDSLGEIFVRINPLKVISGDQVEPLRHTDAAPSTAHLAPRAFSTRVVDSLGEFFVWINPLDITALKKLEYSRGE